MSRVIAIGLSGMRAAEARLGAAAANIANAQSAGRPGATGPEGAYQPVDVVTFSTGAGDRSQGVGYKLVPRQPATELVADPDSPLADENGNVAMPNVDLTNEVGEMITARADFLASAMVVKVGDEMTRAAIAMADGRRPYESPRRHRTLRIA